MRLRYRAIYGAAEVAAALGTLIFIIAKGRVSIAPNDDSEWQTFLTNYLGLLGVIYIFVRGLDNIDQGLTNIGSLRRLWNVAIRDEPAASQSPTSSPTTPPNS
jgi:hypothetical protein